MAENEQASSATAGIDESSEQAQKSRARPRRQVRAAKRLPEDFVAHASPSIRETSESRTATSANGRERSKGKSKSTAKVKVKGKGKRKVESDVDNEMEEITETEQIISVKTEKKPAKAKTKATKVYDLDFILTSSKSPLVNLDILVRLFHFCSCLWMRLLT